MSRGRESRPTLPGLPCRPCLEQRKISRPPINVLEMRPNALCLFKSISKFIFTLRAISITSPMLADHLFNFNFYIIPQHILKGGQKRTCLIILPLWTTNSHWTEHYFCLLQLHGTRHTDATQGINNSFITVPCVLNNAHKVL